MRKLIFLFLLMCCIVKLKAQSFDESSVDNFIYHIPAKQTFSTSAIANYVNQHFNDDAKKVYAIYSWVASNIRYDTDSANIINLGPDPEAKITEALRRRKGVCENYAAIFNDICIKAGLKSFVVDGYTKQNGVVDKTAHSWCAVYIDSTWQLCDPTWDEGAGNRKYFLITPFDMITTHMPFDPMWQLLNYPVSHKQFYRDIYFADKSQPTFNYTDSINAYCKMDSLQRFKTAQYRIEHSGLFNNMVKNRDAFTKMNIEIIRQDKDVDLYNSSVADLNNATETYNYFVSFRNKQFMPFISDSELKALFNGVDTKLFAAFKKLDEIEKTEATFKFGTDDVRDKLNKLAVRIKEQKDFLMMYLNTPVNNRAALFYTRQLTKISKQ